MKKRHYLRFVFCLIALLVLSVVGIGTIYAWTMHEVSVENNLQSRNESVSIEEHMPSATIEAGGTKTKQVAFENTGTAPVFLRVAYVEHWESADSAWLADDGSHAAKNWTGNWTSQWQDGGDGWYYYKYILAAGDTTDRILESVTFPAALDASYLGGSYELSFLVETVQAGVIEDSGAMKADTRSVQTVFGRSATVTGETFDPKSGVITSGNVSW